MKYFFNLALTLLVSINAYALGEEGASAVGGNDEVIRDSRGKAIPHDLVWKAETFQAIPDSYLEKLNLNDYPEVKKELELMAEVTFIKTSIDIPSYLSTFDYYLVKELSRCEKHAKKSECAATHRYLHFFDQNKIDFDSNWAIEIKNTIFSEMIKSDPKHLAMIIFHEIAHIIMSFNNIGYGDEEPYILTVTKAAHYLSPVLERQRKGDLTPISEEEYQQALKMSYLHRRIIPERPEHITYKIQQRLLEKEDRLSLLKGALMLLDLYEPETYVQRKTGGICLNCPEIDEITTTNEVPLDSLFVSSEPVEKMENVKLSQSFVILIKNDQNQFKIDLQNISLSNSLLMTKKNSYSSSFKLRMKNVEIKKNSHVLLNKRIVEQNESAFTITDTQILNQSRIDMKGKLSLIDSSRFNGCLIDLHSSLLTSSTCTKSKVVSSNIHDWYYKNSFPEVSLSDLTLNGATLINDSRYHLSEINLQNSSLFASNVDYKINERYFPLEIKKVKAYESQIEVKKTLISDIKAEKSNLVFVATTEKGNLHTDTDCSGLSYIQSDENISCGSLETKIHLCHPHYYDSIQEKIITASKNETSNYTWNRLLKKINKKLRKNGENPISSLELARRIRKRFASENNKKAFKCGGFSAKEAKYFFIKKLSNRVVNEILNP